METISLRESTDRLTLKDGQFIQWNRETIREVYPIRCTESVEVYGNAQITTQAVKECLKEGIRINYFNIYGKYLGRAEPGYPKNIRRRMEQYRLYFEPERRLAWSKSIIAAKIQGEIVEIRRLREQKSVFPVHEFRAELRRYLSRLPGVTNLHSLLGVEGACARIYYRIFPYILPEGITWNGRSHHPPADRFNAILSLIYGTTSQMIRNKLEQHSLDPHCGFLHEPGYGGGGLACDLLEAVRATFCDHLAFRLVRRERDVREFAAGADPVPTRLPEPLAQIVCDRTQAALQTRFHLQKQNPAEQIDELLRRTINGLEEHGPSPEFIGIHPER